MDNKKLHFPLLDELRLFSLEEALFLENKELSAEKKKRIKHVLDVIEEISVLDHEISEIDAFLAHRKYYFN